MNSSDTRKIKMSVDYVIYMRDLNNKKKKKYKNYYPIEIIENIYNLFNKDNPSRELIEYFAFKVDEEQDILCTGEKNFGYCLVYKSKNPINAIQKNIDEVQNYLKQLKKAKHIDEVEKPYLYNFEEPCTDYPYVVYIAGIDDNSYTKVLKTEKEALGLAEIIKTEKKLYAKDYVETFKFKYTN